MITRRNFLGIVGMSGVALALPGELIGEALGNSALRVSKPLAGWVTLVLPETPDMVKHSFLITDAVIDQMIDTFEPLVVAPDFDYTKPCGFISQVMKVDGRIDGKLELPSHSLPLLNQYKAIVPSFFLSSGDLRKPYSERRAKLIGAALTNTPALPGYEL